MNEKELIIRVAFLVLGGVGLALLAKRKNRSPWPWGVVGALCGAIAPLLLLPPLLVLGFLKYKCPKCGATVSNEQARSGQCPACVSRVTTAVAS
jgi:rubrerythrin